MIHINSMGGRIGQFWWVNAATSSFVLIDATYKGSHHLVWRPGVSGWGVPSTFTWLIIK
jgi:hypothetical protein